MEYPGEQMNNYLLIATNKMLPELYQMDDYEKCVHDGKIFCKVDAHLQSTDDNNGIWSKIKDSLSNEDNFDRSILHRGYCLTKGDSNDIQLIKEYSKLLVDNEISGMNLTSTNIDVLTCTDGLIPISSYDIIIVILVTLYICFVLFATYEDIGRRDGKKVGHTFHECFSLHQSWKKRVAPLRNEDSKKLKSMQGIRCYNLLVILFVHMQMSYIQNYIKNPFWIEQVKPNWNLLFVFAMFVVLTFILISSWLLTNQVLEIHKTYGHFPLKHACIIVINRYFRTAVVNLVGIAISNTHLGRIISGPISMEMLLPHEEACRINWFYSLIYINNFHYVADMCNAVSWYLSADFQLYILNIIALYVILKYKLNFTKVIIYIMACSSIFYAVIIHIYDMDVIFRPYTRNLEPSNFYHSLSFFVSYTSTYSIMTCTCVGMIFGMIYFRTKDKKIENNSAIQFLWALLFFGLPLISVVISGKERRGITAVILGPLVKPLFVSGIGFGILGMSHGIGGIIKKICECKLAMIVANFSYCIYISQALVVFINVPFGYHPFSIGYLDIIADYIVSVPICFAAGGIFTLLVEEPGITLQKMLLPQVRGAKIGRKKYLNESRYSAIKTLH